jgi:hypothetical protein
MDRPAGRAHLGRAGAARRERCFDIARIQSGFGSRSFSVALGHISRDEFMAYLLGRDLEPGVAERIEQHIAECDACAELGEQVDNIIEAFGWNRKGGAAGSE